MNSAKKKTKQNSKTKEIKQRNQYIYLTYQKELKILSKLFLKFNSVRKSSL